MHRDVPIPRRIHLYGLLKVPLQHPCTRPICLIDDKDIRYLDEACLHGLNHVSTLWSQHDDNGIGNLHDCQLGLPHTHGLDNDPVKPHGIQQIDHLTRRS